MERQRQRQTLRRLQLRGSRPWADHYPRLEAHGGHLTPDNVRLGHRLCNRRDPQWRMKINALLGKRMSLQEIAEKLNAEQVPTIHGTNSWTAAAVRKAFVS
jgi:DNA-binding transcriptional MerR regulator